MTASAAAFLKERLGRALPGVPVHRGRFPDVETARRGVIYRAIGKSTDALMDGPSASGAEFFELQSRDQTQDGANALADQALEALRDKVTHRLARYDYVGRDAVRGQYHATVATIGISNP